MIVGLVFIYVGFCPINKWYITVVTWALVVCTLGPRACGPHVLGVYIRQTTGAHVITYTCIATHDGECTVHAQSRCVYISGQLLVL